MLRYISHALRNVITKNPYGCTMSDLVTAGSSVHAIDELARAGKLEVYDMDENTRMYVLSVAEELESPIFA